MRVKYWIPLLITLWGALFGYPRKPMMVILLQDESGSMDRTDPKSIRLLGAYYLGTHLNLSGKENLMGLIIFATRPYIVFKPSSEFEKINEVARKGLKDYQWKPPDYREAFLYQDVKYTPPRMFTDIRAALEMAYNILDETNGNYDKHVILLTDGKVDPWPGFVDRFGDIAIDYKNLMKSIPIKERWEETKRFKKINKKEIAEVDKQEILTAIARRFRERGWRIHTIGFSEEVDAEFLSKLAMSTGGKYGIAKSFKELSELIKRILPKPYNVVNLKIEQFCRTPEHTTKIEVPGNIEEVVFEIDFTRILKIGGTPPLPDQISVILTSPAGEKVQYSQDEYYTNEAGQVLVARYFVLEPESGLWTLQIKGKGGYEPCGEVRIKGRRKQEPLIVLLPQKEKDQWTRHLNTATGNLMDLTGVKAFIKGEETNYKLLKVMGYLQSIEGERKEIKFSLEQDSTCAIGDLQGLIKNLGEYFVVVKMVEKEYKDTFEVSQKLEIKPWRGCEAICTPGRVDLGMLTDAKRKVSKKVKIEIEPECEFWKPARIEIIKPVLTMGKNKISQKWISVEPEKGRLTREIGFEFTISVELPKEFRLPSGKYSGYIKAKCGIFEEGEIEIPVSVFIKTPQYIIKPAFLKFKWWLRVGNKQKKSFILSHTSALEKKIRICLPAEMKSMADEPEPNLVVSFDKDSVVDFKEISLAPKRSKKIVIYGWIKDARRDIPRHTTVPAGQYKGKIKFVTEGIPDSTLSLQFIIPESPKSKLFAILMGVIAFLFLLASTSNKNKAKNMIQRKPRDISGDKKTGQNFMYQGVEYLIIAQDKENVYVIPMSRRGEYESALSRSRMCNFMFLVSLILCIWFALMY